MYFILCKQQKITEKDEFSIFFDVSKLKTEILQT